MRSRTVRLRRAVSEAPLRVARRELSEFVEGMLRSIGEWKKVEIAELSEREDHVSVVVSIPQRTSVGGLMDVPEGKGAVSRFKGYPRMNCGPYWGNHLWA